MVRLGVICLFVRYADFIIEEYCHEGTGVYSKHFWTPGCNLSVMSLCLSTLGMAPIQATNNLAPLLDYCY